MPVAALSRHASTGVEAERRLAEKARLAKNFITDRRRRVQALCDGPNGPQVRELMRFARTMTLKSGRELVARIEVASWAHTMPAGDRHLLLSILSGAIILMRERHGLPGLDDPLWDQPPNVFEQIKRILEVW